MDFAAESAEPAMMIDDDIGSSCRQNNYRLKIPGGMHAALSNPGVGGGAQDPALLQRQAGRRQGTGRIGLRRNF